MKFKEPLSPSTVRRSIGPVSESAPGYSVMRSALESPVRSEADWVCRKIARRWCEVHALVRLYRRLRGEKSVWKGRGCI
jgi:hypothetical protein